MAQRVLPIEWLVGGPLQALVQAHALISQSALQFIKEVGFESVERDESAPLEVRTLTFSYRHPVPDPSNPGQIVETLTHVKVPLLALVSPPAFKVERATIEFNVKVLGVTSRRQAELSTPALRLPFTIQGVYAPKSADSGQPGSQDATLSIKLALTKENIPEGVSLILRQMQDAIVAQPIVGEESQ